MSKSCRANLDLGQNPIEVERNQVDFAGWENKPLAKRGLKPQIWAKIGRAGVEADIAMMLPGLIGPKIP